MALEIVRNDITKMTADAIVNTANPKVAVGAGVDEAVYRAAGMEELLAEREKIGPMQPGDVAVTPAFHLNAKYIIHAVGPAWEGGTRGEVETVASCYRKSLAKAKELQCESIAFPLLASGTYGFPKDVALKTAVSEISGFLFENEMTVYLVVYDRESFEVSGKAFRDIRILIDENEVKASAFRPARRRADVFQSTISEAFSANKWFGQPAGAAKIEPEADEEAYDLASASVDEPDELLYDELVAEADIDDALKYKEETFQEYLFRLIDKKGLDDVVVYKKANIDRKHFSKIKSNADYNPSKRTAVAFALALGLNMDETRDLLLRAGIALSNSNAFDIIVRYCIEHHVTDIMEINCILFKYGQPTLGA